MKTFSTSEFNPQEEAINEPEKGKDVRYIILGIFIFAFTLLTLIDFAN